MKRTITFTLAVLAALAMTACGAKNETELSENSTSTTTLVTDTNTQTSVAETEDTTVIEETLETPQEVVDYSEAKRQIDEFYESHSDYSEKIIKYDDETASWFAFVSYMDYENGGNYDGNWYFYVADENAKCMIGNGGLSATNFKDETQPVYDYYYRIGDGIL